MSEGYIQVPAAPGFDNTLAFLREGYDFFERERVPPEVTVEGGRYRFK